MKFTYPRLILGLVVSAMTAIPAVAAPLRILYFTKSAGYEHSAIKEVDGKPSYSANVLAALGAKHGLVFTCSKDGSLFSPQYLAQFDVVLFYTTGDLCTVGTDGHPAMTAAGKQALLDYVQGGGGFVGVHSSSDTFHTNEHGGGNNPIRGQRYTNYGDACDSYVKLLGGEFIRHGPQQVARATIVSPQFPGHGALGAELNVKEEWYTLKEFSPDNHVLLVMQTAGMEGGDYARPPYPLAWARLSGKGRVAYNAMGHREDIWDSAAFQSMLLGMLQWAAGRVQADVTPNLEQVTPGHAKLQAQPAEVK
jgi:type 1 glutamine amidotransferase